jgi:hypothetical protein
VADDRAPLKSEVPILGRWSRSHPGRRAGHFGRTAPAVGSCASRVRMEATGRGSGLSHVHEPVIQLAAGLRDTRFGDLIGDPTWLGENGIGERGSPRGGDLLRLVDRDDRSV